MIDRILSAIEWNKKFLQERVEQCYKQMQKFKKIVLNYRFKYFPTEKEFEAKLSKPEMWYVAHLLFPSFGAISTNLLIGNPRGCFMELRLLTEGLACCYFSESIKELKSCQGSGGVMKCVDKMLNLKEEKERSFHKLWGKLNRWVHVSRFGRWVYDWFKEEEEFHSWDFIIPVRYSDEDLKVLEEFTQCLSTFLDLLQLCLSKLDEE